MRWFTVKSRWMLVESVYFSSIGAQAYDWPGNAHELQNAMLDEAAVVQALGFAGQGNYCTNAKYAPARMGGSVGG